MIAWDATRGEDAYAFECLRCGTKQRFATPIDLEIYLAAAAVFKRQHENCQPREKASGS